jgi:hypothetical protein
MPVIVSVRSGELSETVALMFWNIMKLELLHAALRQYGVELESPPIEK